MEHLDEFTKYYHKHGDHAGECWGTLIEDNGYDVIIQLHSSGDRKVFYRSELLAWIAEDILRVESPILV